MNTSALPDTQNPAELDDRHHRSRSFVAALAAGIALTGCVAEEQGKNSDESEQGAIMHFIERPETVPKTLKLKRIAHAIKDAQPKHEKRLPGVLLDVREDDGELVASRVAKGIKLRSLSPLQSAVVDNKLWIDTAIDTGSLDAVRFTFQEDYMDKWYRDGHPHYVPGKDGSKKKPSIVEYELPSTKQVSTELITTMIRHEVVHALTQNLAVQDKYGNVIFNGSTLAVDRQRYQELCGEIRSIGVIEAASHALETADLLRELGEYQPAWKSVTDAVEHSIRNQTYGEYQPSQGEAEGNWSAMLQSCQVDNPWRAVIRGIGRIEAEKSNIANDDRLGDLFQGIMDSWTQSIAKQSIYAVISESTYLKGHSNGDDMGHPYDGAGEMMASLLTVVTRYPDELRSNIQKLPVEQQSILHDLLRLVSADIIRAHDNSELSDEIKASVSKVLAR